jgi:hypothetical protein
VSNVSEPPTSSEEEPESSSSRELPPLGDWLRAIAGGVKDTWGDILGEGRKAARRTHDAKWARFEAKRKRGGVAIRRPDV